MHLDLLGVRPQRLAFTNKTEHVRQLSNTASREHVRNVGASRGRCCSNWLSSCGDGLRLTGRQAAARWPVTPALRPEQQSRTVRQASCELTSLQLAWLHQQLWQD